MLQNRLHQLLKLSLFGLIFIPLHLFAYTLSICALFQNEAPYLKEWIEFHRLIGVEHFYLYNHLSTDEYLQVLQPYIDENIVELSQLTKPVDSIETFLTLQINCYSKCLNEAKGKSQWIAFLDIDEFLLPLQTNNLKPLLKEFEYAGGIGVNWLMFGTSHVKQIPSCQTLIETLTHCSNKSYAPNRYIKSIVQVNYASHFEHPHYPVYLKGYAQVNTDHLEFNGQFSTYIRTNRLRINHYWTRDENYFYQKKIARQIKWGGTPNPKQLLQDMNHQEDKEILRFLPALKKSLNT